MAQPMSGKDSAPRAMSNDPVSIFAKEEKKPSRKQQSAEPAAETSASVAPAQSVASDDLAYLIAQKKALSGQIKAAKLAKKAAAKAKPEATKNAVFAITQRVRASIKAGKSQDDALNEVFKLYRSAVEAALSSSTAE